MDAIHLALKRGGKAQPCGIGLRPETGRPLAPNVQDDIQCREHSHDEGMVVARLGLLTLQFDGVILSCGHDRWGGEQVNCRMDAVIKRFTVDLVYKLLDSGPGNSLGEYLARLLRSGPRDRSQVPHQCYEMLR